MKRLLLISLLACTLHAGELPRRHARKLWFASAGMLAGAVLADGLSSRGHRELNPILGTGAFGPRQASIKFGMTAGMVALEAWTLHKRPQTSQVLACANFAMLPVFAVTVKHNLAIQEHR